MYRTKVSTRLALQFKISFSFVVFCFAASLRISFFTNIDSLSLRFLLLFFYPHQACKNTNSTHFARNNLTTHKGTEGYYTKLVLL